MDQIRESKHPIEGSAMVAAAIPESPDTNALRTKAPVVFYAPRGKRY